MAIVTVLLLFNASAANAQDDEKFVSLIVKPLLCITDRRSQACPMSFVLQWTSRQLGAYCLHNDFSENPLRCWEAADKGSFSEDRMVRNRFSYWMTEPPGDTRVVEVAIEMMTADSPDRRRNRRSRHAWSIL